MAPEVGEWTKVRRNIMSETTVTQENPTENGETAKTKKPKPIYQTTPIEIHDDDSQVRQWYGRLINQTLEIDAKVDAGSDTETRKRVTSDLVENQQGIWEPSVNHLKMALEKVRDEEGDRDKFVGIYLGIVRGLSSLFKNEVEAYVDTLVEQAPTPDDVLSEEDKKALMEERKALVGQIRTIIEMAKTFNEFDESNPWYEPKRRGAVGSRGKRALSFYNWTIDGQTLPEDEQSVAGVYPKVGFTKAADLTAALKAAGIDTTNPPREFSVTVNGKTVVATDTRPEGEEDDDDEAEESEDAAE
jgi:hypothetical protein